ncbi:MAG TPA: hypothetical protein VKM94_14180 [Blastocatellia bacterium]|nr:hypothetical protein [Blastocatellia bacterium]
MYRLGILATLLHLLTAAPTAASLQQSSVFHPESFDVGGVRRNALVYPGSGTRSQAGAAAVFVFHGHSGTAAVAAQRFRIHELWPEAVVVYMQGIPGVPGIQDPEAKQTSWQKLSGQVGDRDVKFFDAALERIQKKYRIDPSRIYVLGHSNGSRFVNVLWNMRGQKIAALCAACGSGEDLIETASPNSVFVIAGRKDPLVPLAVQLQSIERIRKLLKTDQSKAREEGYARFEPGVSGTELVTYIHPDGHALPLEALPMVITFFQRHKNASAMR